MKLPYKFVRFWVKYQQVGDLGVYQIVEIPPMGEFMKVSKFGYFMKLHTFPLWECNKRIWKGQ